MTPSRPSPRDPYRRFTAAGWQIDPAANELERPDGERLRIEARAMDVLVRLLDRAGEVVGTDQLLDEVWGGAAVSAHSVAIVISDLRRAFGDDAREPSFIETVPKRGYRWIAGVDEKSSSTAGARSGRRWALVVGGAAIVIGGAWFWSVADRGGTARTAPLKLDRASSEKFFQARQLWSRREPEGALAAKELLEQILVEHEEFAPAHAALADLYVHKTGEYLGVTPLEAFRAGQRHLDRALELDPEEPDLYVTQALLAFYRDRQPAKALAALDRALELDPRVARAWQSRGMVLSATGEHEASLAAIRRARELDPASAASGWDEVWFLYLAGRPEEGLAALERESRVGPRNRFYEALLEESAGRRRAAIEIWLARFAERGAELTAPEAVRSLAATDADEAYRELLRQLSEDDGYSESPGVRLVIEALASDADAVVATLSALRAERHETWILHWLPEMPAFAGLLGEPRVRELLEIQGVLSPVGPA